MVESDEIHHALLFPFSPSFPDSPVWCVLGLNQSKSALSVSLEALFFGCFLFREILLRVMLLCFLCIVVGGLYLVDGCSLYKVKWFVFCVVLYC